MSHEMVMLNLKINEAMDEPVPGRDTGSDRSSRPIFREISQSHKTSMIRNISSAV